MKYDLQDFLKPRLNVFSSFCNRNINFALQNSDPHNWTAFVKKG